MGLIPLLRSSPELGSAIADERAESSTAPVVLRRSAGAKTGVALSVIGFLVLWCAFFAFNRAVPYVANGSDIVKITKKKIEMDGNTFPSSFGGTKLAVFGNSKVLAGFIPDEFDSLAARDKLSIYSFNSGLPAQSEFVRELEWVAERGPAPDVILLTIPWQPSQKGNPFFTLPADDNEIADKLFPFRLLARNLARFAADCKRFGGPAILYLREKAESEKMLNARGYYFIKGQSNFAGNSLPVDYTLPTDDPTRVAGRPADFSSMELDRLNRIIEQHHIRCFFVPIYLRSNEAAPAPATNPQFAAMLAQHSSCRAIGPDYFTYSPVLFSDDSHLNDEGATLYTEDIYKLISPYLRRAPDALQ